MNYLNQLTPAEVYILTKENSTKNQLIRLTLVDLILKKVLQLKSVTKKPSINLNNNLVEYRYVAIGENFKNYKFKNHERVFCGVYEIEKNIEVLLNKMISIGFKNSYYLNENTYKTPLLLKCFSQNFFQRIFGKYKITEYGKEFRRKVENEISTLNKEYSTVRESDNYRILELSTLIGANILFLTVINHNVIDELLSEINSEISKNIDASDSSGCGGGGCSSSDSGCGSSGCGGCGGCGG